LQVKKLNKDALLPVKGSAMAAGYDLHAIEDAKIPARGKACIGTGLAFAIPYGNYGRIAPRSGLAAKHSIDVGAGVIDSDYRGEVKVLLFNLSDTDFEVKAGERISQLIIEKFTPTEIVEVEGKLDDTVRGDGGFGSTGIQSLTNGNSEKV
jgi:dUTP pyrophosphatase